MNEEAIKLLYDDLQTEFDVGTIDDFTLYLNDDTKREKFFNEIILPKYDVETIEDFETTYGLKKKDDSELPLVDGLSERSEAQKKFDAAGKRLLAGAARIPTYVAEMTAVGVGMFNPEFKDYYNSLSIDDRETFLATVSKGVSPGTTTGSLLGFQDVGNEAFSRLTKEAEAIESTLETFDTGITEDIFSENVGRGLKRLLNEAYGAIPSVAAAFTPGGIAVIGAGEAASKSRELQEQGLDLDLRTAINATGSGIAEGIFEGVTRKLGKGLFKSLSGKTKEDALIGITKAVGGVLKGMGLEGSSEVGTLISQQALDKWVTRDEDAFVNIISQGLDTFLIGAAVGGPISGLDVGFRKLTQVKAAKNLNKTIEKTKYKDLVSAFTPSDDKPTLELEQIDIINDPNAKTFLEGTLLKQVKRNEITQEEADKILESYDKTVSLYYEVAGLNLSQEQQIKAAKLIEEKKQLEKLIAGKDESIVKKERDKINKINKELEKISDQSAGITTIKEATKEDAVKALAEEGVLTPTDDQILNKLDELTKIRKDAIQKSSTEKIPLSEESEASPAVGDGDPEGAVPTGEIASEETQATQQAEEGEDALEISEDEIVNLSRDIERQEDQGTLNDNIGEKAYRDGEEGMIKIDDQNVNTIVFETDNKIYELGNIDEIGNDFIVSKGLSLIAPEGVDVTKVDDAADVIDVDGIKYKIIGRRRDKKGKAVVRVKEIETGLDRRFVGEKAERILKDQALKKPSTPLPVSITLERTQTTQPEINQTIYEQKSLNEIIELEKKAKKDLEAFEKKVLEEMVSETVNKDLVQVKENIFQVTQQPDGQYKVSQMRDDGKLVPRLDEKIRTAAINKFKQDKNSREKDLIKKADKKINEFKKNQEDKIISALDNLIKATSTKGKAFDATLGIPLSIANSSLKVIKAAYKAGKSLAAAIADGVKFLKNQGYAPNEIEYKKFVLKGLQKPKTGKVKREREKIKEKPTAKAKVPSDPVEPAPGPPVDKDVQEGVDNLKKQVFNKITDKILNLNLGNIYSKLKGKIFGRGVVSEDVRGLPLSKVDMAFGNKNSTLIYRTIFRPLATSYSKLSNNLRKKINIAETEALKLYKETRDHNKAIENGYRISIALKALEAESNPDSDKVNSVVAELNETIKEAKRGRILTERDAEVLEKLLKQYEKNGQIKYDDVYNSLSVTQQSVFKTLQKENKLLEDFAKTAAKRRGIELETLKNYTHRVVLGKPNEMVDAVKNQAAKFADPNTKAGTIIPRKKGVKPVSFDPFDSYLKGTQETYLDYYMTPDVFKVQEIAQTIEDTYIDSNKGQRESAKALNSAVREILQATYLRSFLRTKGSVATEIQKMGYRAMLASVPRAAAELAGNAIMLSIQPSQVLKDAVNTYAPISMKVGEKANEKFTDILTNLGSTEVDKVGGRLVADTKFADPNNFISVEDLGKKSFGNVRNKMEAIIGLGKKGYKNLNKVADLLMGGVDKATSRPLWISRFAYDFANNVKKINNENIKLTVKDFNEISDGTSPYLTDKYKKARDNAAASADKIVIELVTSGNPFNAIIKNIRRPGDSKNFYRRINSFMANFTLNEYATARYAIGALQRSGEISKTEAQKLIVALLGRMSSYMVAYTLFSNAQDKLFGAEEDEEDAVELFAARQAIGSALQLMFRQNLGNVASLPINAGIEFLNKQYLEGLRDGKPYNSYENAITFSLINLDELSDEGILETVALVGAGPYSSLLKALSKSVKNIARELEKDTPPSAEVKKDLLLQSAFDIGGNTGLVPAYRDIKRVLDKKKYGGRDLAKPSKTSLKELELINPDLAKEIREINKQFRDIEKAFED